MTTIKGFHVPHVICTAIALASLSLLPGCGERKPERVYRCLPGIAKAIDLETNVVAMDFTRPEGDVMEIKGQVTPETEILINGRVAKLGDVQVGEEVEVTGYIEGKGANARIIATRVVIERPEVIKTIGPRKPATQPATQAATQPTTQPATGPATKPAATKPAQ